MLQIYGQRGVVSCLPFRASKLTPPYKNLPDFQDSGGLQSNLFSQTWLDFEVLQSFCVWFTSLSVFSSARLHQTTLVLVSALPIFTTSQCLVRLLQTFQSPSIYLIPSQPVLRLLSSQQSSQLLLVLVLSIKRYILLFILLYSLNTIKEHHSPSLAYKGFTSY